jgi:flagellar basal-body rod protein FlgB
MAISNIPLFSMLRTRMHWHQERQRVLAENVANADTPRFQPRDLVPPKLNPVPGGGATVTLVRTSPVHFAAGGGNTKFQIRPSEAFEVRQSGNAVSLEDEMLKVASNQMDYQAATTLHTRGLGLIRSALGRRA